MDEGKNDAVNPLKVFQDAWSAWARNFIPVFALSCVSLFFGRLFCVGQRACNFFPAAWPADASVWLALALSVFVLLSFFVLLFLDSLIALMILYCVHPGRKGKPLFASGFQEATARAAPFFKTLLLWMIFVVVLREASRALVFAGKIWAASQASSSGKIAVLIGTGTPAVILLIAAAWYGFAFSLGPLVAAYEKKPIGAAFLESRRRVRGRALRYLCSMVMATVLYLAAGLAVYYCVIRFTDRRLILNAIDPVMMTVFGPLLLSAWLMNYLELSESNPKDLGTGTRPLA